MKRESLRYIQNARQLLKNITIEDDYYTDKKPVCEAFGTAYLAVLEAITKRLSSMAMGKKNFPNPLTNTVRR